MKNIKTFKQFESLDIHTQIDTNFFNFDDLKTKIKDSTSYFDALNEKGISLSKEEINTLKLYLGLANLYTDGYSVKHNLFIKNFGRPSLDMSIDLIKIRNGYFVKLYCTIKYQKETYKQSISLKSNNLSDILADIDQIKDFFN